MKKKKRGKGKMQKKAKISGPRSKIQERFTYGILNLVRDSINIFLCNLFNLYWTCVVTLSLSFFKTLRIFCRFPLCELTLNSLTCYMFIFPDKHLSMFETYFSAPYFSKQSMQSLSIDRW